MTNLRTEQAILMSVVKKVGDAIMFVRSNYGIIIAFITIVLCIFSDIFRGTVWAYTLYLTMGFGASLWLISAKNRLTFALAFAPIVGYAITAILGSWLIMLDLPVNIWATHYTIIVISLNLALVMFWVKKHPNWHSNSTLKSAINDLSINYFGIILIILPIVIGGLKFSIFRVNPDDAQNYMSMAFYLAKTPFSLYTKSNILFQSNPAISLGGNLFLLNTRWTTSMLMAFSSFISGSPIYRFDFSFSALSFTLLLAPIYKTLKEEGLEIRTLFFLVIGISAGYYGQVVLDSRAVSYCSSIPVMLSFIFFIARIWDDKESYFKGWNVYFGEIFLLIIFMVALFALYAEILPILGLGIFIAAIYYTAYKSVQIKKAILLFFSAVTSVLIIYITLPIYIKYLIGQIIYSQNRYVDWHIHFFSWIFYDFPAGLWGLNPYQINNALSSFIQIYASILTIILIVAGGLLIFRRPQAKTIVLISGFIMTAGVLLFTYKFFRGQFWQAGKIFTYVYPFAMIYIAFIPHEIKSVKFPNFLAGLYPILQVLILCWLVLLSGTSIFRFVVVARGTEYPFYMAGTDHGGENYRSVYNWEIQGFTKILKKTNSVVWLSSDTAYQDMILALSMPFNAKSFNVYPNIGNSIITTDKNLASLPNNLPDYLIVSNDIWQWNSDQTSLPKILLNDQKFTLVKLSHKLPETPILIGIRNTPTWSYPDGRNFWINQEGWLAFLSPAKCNVILSGNSITSEHPSLNLVVDSEPLNKKTMVSFIDKGQFRFLIPLQKGYNFVSIKVKDGLLENSQQNISTAYFKNMLINYTCNTK